MRMTLIALAVVMTLGMTSGCDRLFPKGDKGEKGDTGDTGVSGTVSIQITTGTPTANPHIVPVQDFSGNWDNYAISVYVDGLSAAERASDTWYALPWTHSYYSDINDSNSTTTVVSHYYHTSNAGVIGIYTSFITSPADMNSLINPVENTERPEIALIEPGSFNGSAPRNYKVIIRKFASSSAVAAFKRNSLRPAQDTFSVLIYGKRLE